MTIQTKISEIKRDIFNLEAIIPSSNGIDLHTRREHLTRLKAELTKYQKFKPTDIIVADLPIAIVTMSSKVNNSMDLEIVGSSHC